MMTFHKIKQSQENNCALLDAFSAASKLKNDAALAKSLEVAPPVISKLRHFKLKVGPSLVLKMLEKDVLSLEEIKSLMETGD